MESVFECNSCGGPMYKRTCSDGWNCIKGLKCAHSRVAYASNLLYMSDLSILPASNLGLAEALIDNGKIDNLADIFNFSIDQWKDLADLDYLDDAEVEPIIAKGIEVRSRITILDFFTSIGIPGVRCKDRVRMMIVRGQIKLTTVGDAKASIGRILMNWDTYHGMLLGPASMLHSEDSVRFLHPIRTRIEIQKLAEVFIPHWVSEFNLNGVPVEGT